MMIHMRQMEDTHLLCHPTLSGGNSLPLNTDRCGLGHCVLLLSWEPGDQAFAVHASTLKPASLDLQRVRFLSQLPRVK